MWRRFGKYTNQKKAQKRLSGLAIFKIVEQELRNEIPIAKHRWRKHTDFQYLNPYIEAATARAEKAEETDDHDGQAAAWLLALILRSPRAAQAQAVMDKHRRSYRNKAARTMELIDFNDAFVSTVLAMPEDHLHEFTDELQRLQFWFCKRVGAWSFSDAQFEAIVHGLSREIAVFKVVQSAGYAVNMTSRAQDAIGIDMQITDRQSGTKVNVDTKTTSAYHYRLIDLLREGRLDQLEIDEADRRGFVLVINGHGGAKTPVVLWRIDQNEVGKIDDFRFSDSEKVIEMLRAIMGTYGEGNDV